MLYVYLLNKDACWEIQWGVFFSFFFYIDSLKGITLQMLQVKCHALLVFLLVFGKVVLALISLASGALGGVFYSPSLMCFLFSAKNGKG